MTTDQTCPVQAEGYTFDAAAWKAVVKRAKQILADPSSVSALPEGEDGFVISPAPESPKFKDFERWARIERFALEAVVMWTLGKKIEKQTADLVEKIASAVLEELKGDNSDVSLTGYIKLGETILSQSGSILRPVIIDELIKQPGSVLPRVTFRLDQLQKWRDKPENRDPQLEDPQNWKSLILAGLKTELRFARDIMEHVFFVQPILNKDIALDLLEVLENSRPLAPEAAKMGLANLSILAARGQRFTWLLAHQTKIVRGITLGLRKPIDAIAAHFSEPQLSTQRYENIVAGESPRMMCPAFFRGPDGAPQSKSMFDVIRNLTVAVYKHEKIRSLWDKTLDTNVTPAGEPITSAPVFEREYGRPNSG